VVHLKVNLINERCAWVILQRELGPYSLIPSIAVYTQGVLKTESLLGDGTIVGPVL
jgi:hypothetical protein